MAGSLLHTLISITLHSHTDQQIQHIASEAKEREERTNSHMDQLERDVQILSRENIEIKHKAEISIREANVCTRPINYIAYVKDSLFCAIL